MLNGTQITLADESEEYRAFVEKFKTKKTTDDCYTPANIYDVIRDWAVREYSLEGREIVRPFWPGGDYERFDYPPGCVVIDNPPFSIGAEIVRTYNQNGIDYFLFAPYLTNMGIGCGTTSHLITGTSITYENGATVDTAFVTNLDPACIRSVPELGKLIRHEDDKNRAERRKELPKYKYPDEVCTAAMLGYMAKYGVSYSASREDVHFIRALQAQRDAGKNIFGGGFLLSEKAAAEKAAAEKAAAEKAAAEVWKLSEDELELVRKLGKKE